MTHPLIDLMDDFSRNAKPVRWYHFAPLVGVIFFLLFCVGYTLWSLFR